MGMFAGRAGGRPQGKYSGVGGAYEGAKSEGTCVRRDVDEDFVEELRLRPARELPSGLKDHWIVIRVGRNDSTADIVGRVEARSGAPIT